MSPCPVCGNHVDAKSGKLLPTSKKTLQDYCHSMGIPNTSFQDIETRRYVCYSHFGKNQFYIVDGQKKLNDDPLELEGDIIGGMKFVEHLECGHDEPSTKVALDPSSKSFGVLQKSFTSDSFLHDVQNCSPHFATSLNESFHSLKTNKYCTKNYYYGLKGFTNRTQLAALHHNHNILDTESGKRKKIGKKEYAYRAKHRDGEFVTKQRKTPPDFSWKKTILQKSRIHIPTIHHKKTQGEIEGDITDISENEDEDNPPSRDEYFGRMILNEMGLEEEDNDDNE
uniref:THAP-type domain-containing protein n=1 Tax=Panagrolaimus superbus TaxID=310955 RepID=A0A914YFH3_9BILA